MSEHFIERRITTGLIISTDYITRVRQAWDPRLFRSVTGRRLAGWCIKFYDHYGRAPGREIEDIFRRETRNDKSDAVKDIEDILVSLSDEYDRADKFNVDYLYDQTVEYFKERGMDELIADLQDRLRAGAVAEAETMLSAYVSPITVTEKSVDLTDVSVLERLERAFEIVAQPVVEYPRQLGEFWNSQLLRSKFVAVMSSEKRGKTFLMMDMAVRAFKQGANVAFFQAGDMTEGEQLMRMAIYLTKKSNLEKYSGRMYEPVRDCIHNQLNDCDRRERECGFGPFEDMDSTMGANHLRRQILKEELIDAYKDYPDYRPCYNCAAYWANPWGAVWLREVDTGRPLTLKQAKAAFKKFFIHNNKHFKLSTHPNKTLTVSAIDTQCDLWEREDGFVPDMIVVDYADILASEVRADPRHQENDKWMRLRGLSQKRHALVVTGTQTDADSYNRDLLRQSNFSEDHRKYAHVTAMYGLNQDRTGREKEIGILRINPIVVREDAFNAAREVFVLQNLRRGQPVLSSFW